jgi:hypothetical protein
MAIKPFITAGVALTSAAMIVAGTPALLSSMDAKTVAASAPTPTKLSQAKYDLTTLQSVLALTPADYQNAYFNGWGPFVTSANSYGFGDGTAPDGLGGVFYLVADNLAWDGVTPDPAPNLVNYYFELGAGPAFYIAAQQIGPPVSTVVDLVDNLYVAPTLITQAVLSAAAPLPLFGAAANAYLNGFNGGNAGGAGVIAYAANNVIGRLPGFDLGNPISFFVGDGADADPLTCGTNCNGGNAGILWGNGGDGANGGSGGNAGFFIGNGGNGSNGLDATGTTAANYVGATNGGNGGWGGFLVGNGGNAGNGGSDTVALAGDAVAGDGGTGGTGGILSGNGGTGGNGGSAVSIDGSAYGGFGGAGGQSGLAGTGANGGSGGKAVAVAVTPSDDDVVAVGGDGGAGGASFSGTAGNGGAGGDADYTGADDGAAGVGGAGGASTPLGTAGTAGPDGTLTPAPAAALKKVAASVNGALSSAAPDSTASKVAKSLKDKPAKSTKGAKASASSD